MMPEPLPRDFGAYPAPNRRDWIAWFQAPGVGVQTVRGEGRAVALFPSKTEAEIAAARAKDAAEDRGRQPRPRTAKVFRSTGQGRQRRAIAI